MLILHCYNFLPGVWMKDNQVCRILIDFHSNLKQMLIMQVNKRERLTYLFVQLAMDTVVPIPLRASVFVTILL